MATRALKAVWYQKWFVHRWLRPEAFGGLAHNVLTGPDAGSLTVGGELNKVAANIAMGRNIAGIHWRTDYSESLTLGEEVAIGILEEQQATYNEGGRFTLTRFDGTTVTI